MPATKFKPPPKPKPRPPVWAGPEDAGNQGGITFSLLSRFLTCRERFKAKVIDGWKPVEGFNHRIEYGHLFHVAEEAHYAGQPWGNALLTYRDRLSAKYPLAAEQVHHWWRVASVQMLEYVRYWQQHDATFGQSVGQEYQFRVPYKLPSGRTVYLRGKVDGLFRKPWTIRETKTKGEVDLLALQRQMTFDLQTMLYAIAVSTEYKVTDGPIKVVYNLVTRPLSGGKNSIKRKEVNKTNRRAETADEFYGRLQGVIREDPTHFFNRLEVNVQQPHLKTFRSKCLDPILENVCCWYESVTTGAVGNVRADCMNWIHPFGVRNMLDEGGHTDLDEYVFSGSTVGLERVTELFEELK